MSKLWNVSSSPHVRHADTTSRIMFDVAIAMVPASIYGVWQFGLKALMILIVSVLTCVLSEFVYESFMGKKITIQDGSAVVTGMILALNMPPEVPLWIPMIGSVFAIIVVKQLFGGLGQNFMNPALAARCFLLISFAGRMTTFTLNGVSGATPLADLKAGLSVDVTAMFLGKIPGTIGEVSAPALLIGAAYLVIRKVISLRIPLTYIITTLVFAAIFGGHGLSANYLSFVWWWSDLWCVLYGNRLCDQSDHGKRTVCLWCPPWAFNWNFPYLWRFRRRCVLCYYLLQYFSAADRTCNYACSIWKGG